MSLNSFVYMCIQAQYIVILFNIYYSSYNIALMLFRFDDQCSTQVQYIAILSIILESIYIATRTILNHYSKIGNTMDAICAVGRIYCDIIFNNIVNIYYNENKRLLMSLDYVDFKFLNDVQYTVILLFIRLSIYIASITIYS